MPSPTPEGKHGSRPLGSFYACVKNFACQYFNTNKLIRRNKGCVYLETLVKRLMKELFNFFRKKKQEWVNNPPYTNQYV